MSETITDISLAERAYTQLRDLIVSLELRPGAVLGERDLIERLGVGRTPVREALLRLAQERLVEVYPRRGMFVAAVEIRDLAAISEVRVELEGYAARVAAERATKEERRALDELDSMLVATQYEDPRELMAIDRRVHRQIYQSAHNPYLARTLDEYYVLSLRIWNLAVDQSRELQDAVFGHKNVIEAIDLRKPKAAERLMREHVRGFEESMRKVLVGGT